VYHSLPFMEGNAGCTAAITNLLLYAYDHKRGEAENGKKKVFGKGEDRTALGQWNCIDCFQCVRRLSNWDRH